MSRETEMGSGGRAFPATRWTLIRSASVSEEQRRAALGELLASYWRPLYFFARRKGLAVEPAKDAVQDFAAHLMTRDVLARMDPSKGRFRSYLRTAFANHMANLRQRDEALMRGGGHQLVSLEVDAAEAELERSSHAAPEPDDAFDREWAAGVMERALTGLEHELQAARTGSFEAVRSFFEPRGEAPSYAEAAERAGVSVPALKALLHRARVRYRELVRKEVAHTVGDEAEVDAEIAELIELLGRAG